MLGHFSDSVNFELWIVNYSLVSHAEFEKRIFKYCKINFLVFSELQHTFKKQMSPSIQEWTE